MNQSFENPCAYSNFDLGEHAKRSTVDSGYTTGETKEKVFLCKECFTGYLSVDEQELEEILGTIPINSKELGDYLDKIDWQREILGNWND